MRFDSNYRYWPLDGVFSSSATHQMQETCVQLRSYKAFS